MTTKINFKQPKYIFPLVIFVPLCAMIYFVMQTFGAGGGKKPTVATDRINMNLPEAQAEETGDKLFEMSRRFDEEDAFTAIGSLGEDDKDSMQIEHGYSEEERWKRRLGSGCCENLPFLQCENKKGKPMRLLFN